jgi:hypothetical protein
MSLSSTQYAVRTAQIHAQLALVQGDISAMQPLLTELTVVAHVYYGIGARQLSEQSEREKLIRRRWAETGIKLWNSDTHGRGLAPLNIQGRHEMMPAEMGQPLPAYDNLEFKIVNGEILCEGVVVDPPKALGK